MVRKLDRDALESQINGIDSLMASLDQEDEVGRVSLQFRKDQLAAQLDSLQREFVSTGAVVLSFEGGPVVGSRGVDAEFAADALHSYQDLIAKQMAAFETGGLAQRGPVPDKSSARLNITNIVHGSFGFQLEESSESEPQFIDSAVKRSISAIDDLLVAFASPSDSTYLEALSKVDRRVFIAVQRFYESLYRDSAAVKIIEDERAMTINQSAVILARGRIQGLEVADEEFSIKGELLGLAPIQRRFDFKPDDGGAVISGQVGQKMSDDYLARLHGDKRISGRVYRATMSRRTATRADGSVTVSYTLTDLTDVPPLLRSGLALPPP